jgi:AAA+ ATPase superfamily predicted ATPase
MINRFLSMSSDYLELVNYVQTIPYTEKEKYYKIYCDLLPKKQFWSKYIKSNIKQPNKDLMKYLTTYFECSSKEVTEYLNLLNENQIKDILSDFGIDNKDIKKLIK